MLHFPIIKIKSIFIYFVIGCIIQARMGSTRLPGKVMKIVDEKNPSLYYTINQLKNSPNLNKIIVATTKLSEDDVIDDFCKNMGIECYRGNTNNVLERYYFCSKEYGFEGIVRITADCPLIDPEIVDNVVQVFKNGYFDYVSNVFPSTFPDGLDTEVFTFKALETAWKNAKLLSEKEHVTPYFKNNKKNFKIKNVTNSKDLSHLRFTLDYEEDLQLIIKIIKKIPHKPILMNDIISLFKKEPQLLEINKEHLLMKDTNTL